LELAAGSTATGIRTDGNGILFERSQQCKHSDRTCR
jgi:hypothetical protein